MATDVLIVGYGAREHALVWKLASSPRIGKIYIAPGNPGTAALGENVNLAEIDIEGLVNFAQEKRIALTIVGAEAPLSLGIVDIFRAHGLRIFGPTKGSSQIETSKAFAKKLMQENKINTARFMVFDAYGPALAYLHLQKLPIVIKASGLSSGKGVYICKTMDEAQQALSAVMVDQVHGNAGNEVVIEEFLDGPELSVHALTDGLNSVLFPGSQDHKRLLDGDEGENTGGMGAIAPVPWASLDLMNSIENTVIHPVLKGMLDHGTPFEGLLYPGMIITNDGPKVLEFNARFGDPETQVYMRLLKTDLLDLIEACLDKTLGNIHSSVGWHRGFAVAVTLASGGYPGEYQSGLPITGLSDADAMKDVVVFHAGTTLRGELRTAGGRVLSVTAFGVSPKDAIEKAYAAIQKIHFEGMQYRKDIGAKVSEYYSSIRV